MLKKRERQKNRTITKGTDKIEVIYTNIYEIIPRKLEPTDYLKEKKTNCMPSKHKIN